MTLEVRGNMSHVDDGTLHAYLDGELLPVERAVPPLHQLRPPRLAWRLRVPIAWAASVVLALGLGYYVRGAMLARVAPQAAARLDDSVAPVTGFYAFQDRRPAPRALTR